jgi:hypothetical protein
MTHSIRLASPALALAVLLSACSDAPAITSPEPEFSNAPVESPLHVQFNDINFCGGQIVTYTMDGTVWVQEFGDHYLLVGRGTVTTSDGFTGTFNRTFVFQGDRVTVLRFHDMEVNSATGQRQVFSMGMYLTIKPDGQVAVVDAEKYGGGGCPGS